jgi:hypothetical protein
MRDSPNQWHRAGALLVIVASGCTDPDLASGLDTAGPPTVSAVIVTGETGNEATYCNPDRGNRTPNVCVAGQPVEPVTDVRPLNWTARVVFKELLDPAIEDIDSTTGDGSIARAHPFTLTCGGAVVAYDGFYDPSGNHETTPVGPALVIHAHTQPGAATAAACRLAINPGTVHDKDGAPAPSDVAFAFTIAPLQVRSSGPAAGATGVDPAAPITITLNSRIDAASLAGNVTVTGTTGPAIAAAVTVLANDPTTIVIDPAAALAHGATYTVAVNAGVRDTLGGALAAPHSFAFTTAP